jgi:hypothetical protein
MSLFVVLLICDIQANGCLVSSGHNTQPHHCTSLRMVHLFMLMLLYVVGFPCVKHAVQICDQHRFICKNELKCKHSSAARKAIA